MTLARHEAIVIGAGVAGLSTALYLRRAGVAVVVIDPLPPAGGASFGNNFEGFLPQVGNSFQWTDELTWVKGSHTIKFGADVRRARFDQFYYFDVNGNAHAFVRSTGGTITTFDAPGAVSTYPLSINRRGEKITVNTDPYSVQGKGRGANTAEKVGGGAAVGAILGGILGGGKGAAIGAAAGGGVGAGANTVTRGQQVQIKSETLIRFNLTNTLALKVPTKETDSTTGSPDLQQHPANPPQQ